MSCRPSFSSHGTASSTDVLQLCMVYWGCDVVAVYGVWEKSGKHCDILKWCVYALLLCSQGVFRRLGTAVYKGSSKLIILP